MRDRSRPWIACFALVAVACDGQPHASTVSPLGSDAEIYGEWDVNGAVPTTASCTRAGIDEVEVVLSRADGSNEVLSSALRWPCAATFFDSGTSRLLRAGTFAYRWRALKAGTTVLESRLYEYSVATGDELTLMPVDFVRHEPIVIDAALAFAADTSTGSCASAHVDEGLSWALHRGDVTGPIVASSGGTFGCVNSIRVLDDPLGTLQAGTHTLEIAASAVDGATWRGQCPVDVPDGGPLTVECTVPRAP